MMCLMMENAPLNSARLYLYSCHSSSEQVCFDDGKCAFKLGTALPV